jgi:hypothetical protein
MTRKGEYAILHTTHRAISHPGGITESHTWSCVRAVACYRNGGVKLYQESPGRIEIPADSSRAFLDTPYQDAAREIFEAQTKYETAAELKAALEMEGE